MGDQVKFRLCRASNIDFATKISQLHHEAASGPPPALLPRHGLRLHRAVRLRVPLWRLHLRRRRRETRHSGNPEEWEAKCQEPLRARPGPLGRKLLRADCNLQKVTTVSDSADRPSRL